MSTAPAPCYLCRKPVNIISEGSHARVDCSTCGTYKVSSLAILDLPQDGDARLSAWTRSGTEQGRIEVVTRERAKEPPTVLLPGGVKEKLARTLRWLAEKQPEFGKGSVYFPVSDWPLVSDVSQSEASALLGVLESSRKLERRDSRGGAWELKLTADGWIDVQSQGPLLTDHSLAFVAMSFDQSLNDTFKAMQNSAETAGYRCERVDTASHADHIDHRLIDYLKRCRFVIADFTGGSPNVYFEAGYALALNKPVIWTRRKGESVQFDARQYYFLEWDQGDLETFQSELEESIGAIVGRLNPRAPSV